MFEEQKNGKLPRNRTPKPIDHDHPAHKKEIMIYLIKNLGAVPKIRAEK
jgi:hypothetical protein